MSTLISSGKFSPSSIDHEISTFSTEISDFSRISAVLESLSHDTRTLRSYQQLPTKILEHCYRAINQVGPIPAHLHSTIIKEEQFVRYLTQYLICQSIASQKINIETDLATTERAIKVVEIEQSSKQQNLKFVNSIADQRSNELQPQEFDFELIDGANTILIYRTGEESPSIPVSIYFIARTVTKTPDVFLYHIIEMPLSTSTLSQEAQPDNVIA